MEEIPDRSESGLKVISTGGKNIDREVSKQVMYLNSGWAD